MIRTALVLIALVTAVHPLFAATFTVTNTSDSGPGSLRQAIEDANATPGTDAIHFAIPGPGVKTITLLTELPALFTPMTIDGYTQPGSSANTDAVRTNAVPLVEVTSAWPIDGSPIRRAFNVTSVTGSVVIRGLIINRFPAAIALRSGANHVVAGNFIGTNATGTAAVPNTTGVLVRTNDNIIGGTVPANRNLISGNTSGVLVEVPGVIAEEGACANGASRNQIMGNLIGTDAAGTAAIPNLEGIRFSHNCITGNPDSGPPVSNNFVGGTAPGTRNVISGNREHGVRVGSGQTAIHFTHIEGNFIGLSADGSSPLPNRIGVEAASPHTIVGRNVISANTEDGVVLRNGTAYLVEGNLIGTDRTGLVARPNGRDGVAVFAAATSVARGAYAFTSPTSAVIRLNLIANNGRTGVAIVDTPSARIRENRISANGALGIDLGLDGVTPNDPLDADTNHNDRQNFPVLSSAASGAGFVRIIGTLSSKPNLSYVVEFFASASCDPSGFGEGAQVLGETTVTTDASGNASFNVNIPPAPPGSVITATATDPANNTSEFSACVVARPAVGGTLQFSSATYTVNENAGSVTITVTRTGGDFGRVIVQFRTSDGTANAGVDYTATSGTLTFADGQTSATFTVPILDEPLDESDETVLLTLSDPGGGATLGAPSTATLTILDNDVANAPIPTAGTWALMLLAGALAAAALLMLKSS